MALSMTAAYTIFAKMVICGKCIPFETTADPFYAKSSMTRFRPGIAAFNTGQGGEHGSAEVRANEKIRFEEAWKDYLCWQTYDKKTLKRIDMLIKDINRRTLTVPVDRKG